jgi:hypothetical protein
MCDCNKSCKCNSQESVDLLKDNTTDLLHKLEADINIQMALIDDLEIDLEVAKAALSELEIKRDLIYDLLFNPSSLFPS